ncbi:MAG: hypothetical protein ABR540_08610 [Acidimicrobiales bacterium]
MPPQKPYGVAPGRHDGNVLHIIDSEGALCRLPDVVDVANEFKLAQYLHQATDEAVRRTRNRRLGRERLCSWCAPLAGLDPEAF